MQIEVSIGEGIDKFCILELKTKYIRDADKQRHISNQIELLRPSVWDYIANNRVYYNILTYINEEIWMMTEEIHDVKTSDPKFAKLAHHIFQYTEKRFRLKSILNALYDSSICEQKSVIEHECAIVVDTLDTANRRIAEINYLSIEYDFLYIYATFNIIQLIKSKINNPKIAYKYKNEHDEFKNGSSFISKIEADNSAGLPHVDIIKLRSFTISEHLREVFRLNTG